MYAHLTLKTGLFTAVLISLLLVLTACGNNADKQSTGTATPSTPSNTSTGGLTSAEASSLAWAQAKKTFGDAVLWRLAPIDSRYSTSIKLDPNWQSNDRAGNWFVWYADPAGENWLLITITGKSISKTDIGTRGSIISMSSSLPRETTKISMKAAAAAAAEEGANLDSVSWVEFSCDYAASDFHGNPNWVFTCSDTLPNGDIFSYRILVDGITGEVRGALNDRNERLTLPIDLDELQQTRATDHQADLLKFFGFISDGDPIWAVRQLSSQASPNEAMGQMWLANFQSIKTLKIVSVEPSNLAQWTDEWENYKVTMDISTNEPPEKYGWENGRNVRWVTLIPQGAGGWKVAELAQNP